MIVALYFAYTYIMAFFVTQFKFHSSFDFDLLFQVCEYQMDHGGWGSPLCCFCSLVDSMPLSSSALWKERLCPREIKDGVDKLDHLAIGERDEQIIEFKL